MSDYLCGLKGKTKARAEASLARAKTLKILKKIKAPAETNSFAW